MQMKKEAVSGTGKVNQGLEVTLSWETETRENLRGLDRRGLNGALGSLQHCWGC